MSEPPPVSIITPVYNAGPFLAEALASIWAQTYPDFELLVVDDGSTDDSPAILAQCRDPRLRILARTANLGPAAARNVALGHARGEVIAFFDGDDLAHPDRLRLQLEFLAAHPEVGMINGNVATIDQAGAIQPGERVDRLPPDQIAPALLFRNPLSTSTMTIRRAAIGDRRFDPTLTLASDWEMWVRLLEDTKIRVLPDILTHYRIHRGGILQRKIATGEECTRRIMDNLFARIGVAADADEYAAHRRLATFRFAPDADFVTAADRWLQKIAAANRISHYYPEHALAPVLAEYWFRCCLGAADLGWQTRAMCAASPLANHLPQRTRKLLALSLATARGELKRRCPRLAALWRALARRVR